MTDCSARPVEGGVQQAGPPAARPAADPVAIVLPDTITPGVSKVEVDVHDGERLQMRVPEQARPGDRLIFTPNRGGAWGCSLLRREARPEAAPPASAPPARGRRELEVLVPPDAEAGETELKVDVGGELLLLRVPSCARPGDRLRLCEDDEGQWQCQLEQRREGASAGSRSCGVHVEGEEIICQVPPGAIPGETRLRLSTGKAGESPLLVTVPENALPGDELGLSPKDGTWSLRIIRHTEDDSDCPVPSGRRRDITLSRMDGDPHEFFETLVSRAVAAGAIVSSKIKRGATPPLDALGVVATAPVKSGEELARIPASLHLSNQNFKERFPDLYQAVYSMEQHLGGRTAEAAHAACLARLLQEVAARAQAKAENRTEPQEPVRAGSNDMEQVWDAYCCSILNESWDSHPYWCAIEDPAAVRELLAPSKEEEYLQMMAGDVIAMHDRLVQHLSPDILGPNYNLGFFLQARMCILTRVFQLEGDLALVPINDCFNHSHDAGGTWLWDAERNHMVLVAKRDHAAGEQVFISYGRRSNVLLFRTYGFTLPPQMEPTWTFIVQGKDLPHEIFSKYLPQKLSRLAIHFESGIVQDSLIKAINACKDQGHDPEAFLRDLCEHCLRPYESSEHLQPALAALRSVRAKDPTSAAWWSELPEGHASRSSREEGALPGWEEHALRLKMSEYLCLTAHIEVLDLVAGRVTEDQCLSGSMTARSVLRDGFGILRNGGRFSCSLDSTLPLSMIRGLT